MPFDLSVVVKTRNFPTKTKFGFFVSLVFLSMVGDGMALFALTLAAADQIGSWGVTALFLAGLIPPILAAPAISRLVDGRNLRRTWILSLACHVVIFGVMAAANSIVVSMALMCLASVFAVVSGSAIFKLIPDISAGYTISRASSLVVSASSLAGIIAPTVAAIGYAHLGVTPILLVNAMSFIVLAGVAWAIVPNTKDTYEGNQPPKLSILEGSKVLLNNRSLKVLLIPIAAIVLFTAAEGVAGVFYLRGVSNNDTVYAIMLGAWSIGALIGSLVSGNKYFSTKVNFPVLFGGALIGGAIAFEGFWPNAAAITIAFLIGGFGNGMHNVGLRNAIYEHIPSSQHGTAWAYMMVLINIMVGCGYLIGTPGLLVESDRIIIIVSGLGSLIAVVLAMLALSFIRETRKEVESDNARR